MVAKNGEFFSQPILGRDSLKVCAQRRGIYEVGHLKNVSPATEHSFESEFCRPTELVFQNGRPTAAAW